MRLASLLATVLLVSAPASATDIRVVDGGTIDVDVDGERVRIMGLGASETHQAQCDSEYRLGMRAKDRLAVLVAGGVQMTSHGQDRYRRTLAVVRDARGRDVVAILIREGLARPYEGDASLGAESRPAHEPGTLTPAHTMFIQRARRRF
jgi:micrococcal nuclease